MLTKGQVYFPYWSFSIRLGNWFCAIPYEWDDKSQKIKALGQNFKRRIYSFTVWCHVIYGIVMCLHMQRNYKSMSLPNCLTGLVTIFAYAVCGVARLTLWFWETEGLKMINGFLGFETQLLKSYPRVDKKGSFMGKTTFFVGTLSTGTFVWIFVLLMVEPCTPPYLGSLMPICLAGKGKSLGLVSKLLFALFDGWMWMHVAPPASLTIGNIFYGFCISLQKYLDILCSLSEEKGIKSDEMLKIFNWYGQIQLLITQLNVTCKHLLIPAAISFTSNALIFSLYVCIKLNDVIPMPGFAFFPLILMDSVLIIGVDFAAAGFVYLKSKDIVDGWSKLNNYGRKTGVKAKAKSFQALKVKLGMNYIDELTALTILDYCLNQTVSLLLMT